MNVTSNPTLHAALLLIILSFYASSLLKDVSTFKQGQARLAVTQTRQVGFKDPIGISIDGISLDRASLHSERYIAFLLRNQSLRSDLSFWDQVNVLLGSRAEIKLIGYCDGQSCADSIRTLPKPSFSILAYADAVSAQAVANADAEGLAVLKVAGRSRSSIAWRGKGATPRQTSEEALR
jgi:hypothetical protein